MRKSTNEVLFSTKGANLILSDYYLEISNQKVPTRHIMGLGERNSFLELENGLNTIWTMDQPVEYDDGTQGENTYGHHPLYLSREKSNKFHIVFFRNSNAMDIVIDEVDVEDPSEGELF
jgi:alpha-glucosidase (family GH31 glycosyl hydrolase)